MQEDRVGKISEQLSWQAVKSREKIKALEEVIEVISEQRDGAVEAVGDLKAENDRLKRFARWMWLTLGFYGTEYNYKQKIGMPDGSWQTGIEMDQGEQARNSEKFRALLGFTPDEIRCWPGPKLPEVKTT